MNPPPNLIVPALAKPERMDKFLVQQFPHTSRNFWRAHLPGLVLINGRAATKAQMLSGGETLAFLKPLPEEKFHIIPNPKLELPILFQDEFYLVVDKPTGIPCHPLKSEETNTVVNGIVGAFPEQADVGKQSREAGLAHRLDNDTSGALLFARSTEALDRFMALQKESKVNKEYQAWVIGNLAGEGRITKSIAHHPKNSQKMKIAETEKEIKKWGARPASTRYEALKPGEPYSLVKCSITKGLRHQIRIHLASLDHPIVGDILYGAPASEGRQLLHAWGLSFRHPFTRKVLNIQAPLPSDFKP